MAHPEGQGRRRASQGGRAADLIVVERGHAKQVLAPLGMTSFCLNYGPRNDDHPLSYIIPRNALAFVALGIFGGNHGFLFDGGANRRQRPEGGFLARAHELAGFREIIP